jgi:hypothetical protein
MPGLSIQSVRSRVSPRIICTILAVIWLGLVGIALPQLWVYEVTPGASTISPLDWPAASRIEPAKSLPTLLVFAHPHCPCTRATIDELDQLMARCSDRVEARVLFYQPSELADQQWEKTDIWYAAEKIPGVSVVIDRDGLDAKRFAALTSGHVALYSANKQLLFSGGITGSRGHAGDNAGRSAVESLLLNGMTDRSQSAATVGSLWLLTD